MNHESNGTGYYFLRSPYYESGSHTGGINESASGEYVYVATMYSGLQGCKTTISGVGCRPGINVVIG